MLVFKKSKTLGSILPVLVLVTITSGIVYVAVEIFQNVSQGIEIENKRTKQGFIGVGDDFKVINYKVYRRDTLIAGADGKTFEIINWNWQRDKNWYYFLGKKVDYIDRKTFEDLNYRYGKDKVNVYYDDKIIEGADIKSFTHIEGTEYWKDANSCYRRGERVDCETL